MARNTTGYHVYTRGKGKTLWVWWSDGKGKKIQSRIVDQEGNRISPETSRREADRHAARMYHEWRSLAGQSAPTIGVDDLAQETIAESHSLGELTARFVLSHQNDWSERTQKSYGTQLRYIEEFLGVGTPLEQIRPEDSDAFKLFLVVEKKLASETVKGRLEMARRVFNNGIRIKWTDENPFQGLKPPRKKKVRNADPFVPEEVTQILKTARADYPHLYPIVLTASLTGERRNSIRMLDVKDVDTENMILTFPARYTKQREEIKRPIPKSVQAFFLKLVEGREPDEPLFLDNRGVRYSPLSRQIWGLNKMVSCSL